MRLRCWSQQKISWRQSCIYTAEVVLRNSKVDAVKEHDKLIGRLGCEVRAKLGGSCGLKVRRQAASQHHHFFFHSHLCFPPFSATALSPAHRARIAPGNHPIIIDDNSLSVYEIVAAPIADLN
jgi:hypothetical protein